MRLYRFKKTVSVLCLLALLFTAAAVPVYAANGNTYKNTGNQRQDIIGVAKTQIGYSEESNGVTKYGTYLGFPQIEWCTAFIIWCANQAGVSTAIIPAKTTPTGMKDFFNKNSLYFFSKGHGGSYQPNPGDIVFFSSNSSPASVTHAGLVVSATDTAVNTIEGDYGDKVVQETYSIDAQKIVGYATPNYTSSSYTTGYYRTDDVMRLRSTPTTEISTNILTLIPDGTTLKITSVYGVWGYVVYNEYSGWMSLDYSTYLRPLEAAQDPDDPDDPDPPVVYPELPSNVKFLVADISVFNDEEDFNWSRMKAAGLEAVIIRIGGRGYGAGHTLYEDSAFETHYRNAKAAGLHVGVYFFSYALNGAEAKAEAQFTLRILQNNNCELDMPVFIDIEDYTERDHWDSQHVNAGKDACSEVVNAYCTEIAAAGYYPGVYCNKYFAEEMLYDSVFTGRAVWIAHYGVSQCGYKGRYDMWQYTGTGSLSGYYGSIDLSYCYVDFPSYIISNRTGGNYGDHKIGADWTVTETPTCTAEGERVKRCTDCGIVLLRETVKKSGHTPGEQYLLPYDTSVKPGDIVVTAIQSKLHSSKDPDYQNYYGIYLKYGGAMLTYCTECKKVISATYGYGEIPHNGTSAKTTPATCVKEGITETVCLECGKTLSAALIPCTAHTSGAVTLQNVSCVTEGTRSTACSVCKNTIRTEFVSYIPHQYDEGKVDRFPTLTAPGATVFTCTQCGATRSEPIPSPLFGDIDGSGTVTASDARLAIRAAVELETLSQIALVAADINNNKHIESEDARMILRMSVGLDSASELMKKYY